MAVAARAVKLRIGDFGLRMERYATLTLPIRNPQSAIHNWGEGW